MVKVNITKQSNYPVSLPKLKARLRKFLAESGIVSDAEVALAIVGETKMLSFSRKYLRDNKVHNVLSFIPDESPNFVYPPDGKIHLGEIIVCYPVAFAEARGENKLIEDKVYELVEHGARHLLGEHHK